MAESASLDPDAEVVASIVRRSQQEVLRYVSGRLGISAVPGAGKTHVLSALAASILEDGRLLRGQEVLIVTLVNAAVENFKARIAQFLSDPVVGLYRYRVRTLHGLAHDIVRERPGRVGLEESFGIVDEHESQLILADAVRAWLTSNPHALDSYLADGLAVEDKHRLPNRALPEMLEALCVAFISTAKERQFTPERLKGLLVESPAPLPLAGLATAVYADYQRSLAYRGAVDFDDLMRHALDLLEADPDVLERLQDRYPYILEDEAQDSSIVQEAILRLLSGPNGNWVRVGDPNQAIYETFTTASPELLRDFLSKNPSREMAESGRSQGSIIAIANHLIDWVAGEHPLPEARAALVPPHIRRVPADDLQPNPPEDPAGISFVERKFTPEGEVEAVARSIAKWLPGHLDWTVAALVPRTARGTALVAALQSRGIEAIEMLGSTSSTRRAAASVQSVLAYLAEPISQAKLAQAYLAWTAAAAASDEPAERRTSAPVEAQEHDVVDPLPGDSGRLGRIVHVEDFLAPTIERAWRSAIPSDLTESEVTRLGRFRDVVRRWLAGAVLPVDQLILTIAQDLFSDQADLALAYKLAVLLGRTADDHPGWRLPEMTSELGLIVRNERRFLGLSSDGSGFDPAAHKGKVVVTTMHKAKGLEWDRVYLMSVNNYDFPSGGPTDQYQSERWYLRDKLNIEAEALAQLDALQSVDGFSWYQEGWATAKARVEYIRERLRLLYVGITRARRELIVTWNSGRRGDTNAAAAVEALRLWWATNPAARRSP